MPVIVRSKVVCTITIERSAPAVLGSAFNPIVKSQSGTAALLNASELGLGKAFSFTFAASTVSEMVSVSVLDGLLFSTVAVTDFPDNTSTFKCEYLGVVGQPALSPEA